MRPATFLAAVIGVGWLALAAQSQTCRYLKSSTSLAGYERGGSFSLDHARLTKGRTDLREFLWSHWHGHKKGVAEADTATIDRGTVKVLYVIHPDASGHWGIDVELDRPMDQPCVSFHVDSLARITIVRPEEDYPSQTIAGYWPPGRIPSKRLAESVITDAKFYRVVLVRGNKAIGDVI